MLQLLSMMAQSSEFGQMAIREEELPELDALARDACHFDIKGGPENKHGKVNILLQASAATPLYTCCICDYQSDVFACCWAGIAPTKRWRALLLFALPQLMSLAASSFWVSKMQHSRLSTRLLCLSAQVTNSCNILISAFKASSCLLLHYQCCKTPLHCCVQAYVSRARVESFSLIADMMYVSSNAPRIARSVFEICLRRGWSSCAELALTLCKVCL